MLVGKKEQPKRDKLTIKEKLKLIWYLIFQ